MSLLIKALEQAAKDRKAGRAEGTGEKTTPGNAAPATAAPDPIAAASAEPTLEPLPPPRGGASARAPQPECAAPAAPALQRRAPAPSPAVAPPSVDRSAAPRRAATSLADLQEIDAQQQRVRAATVMQAGEGRAAQAIAFLRGNPVMMIGALAILGGLVFGTYVYLQIAKPGLFVRQVATRPQDAQAPVPPPGASQPGPSGMPETATPGGPSVTGAPAAEAIPPAPGAAASAGTIGTPVAPAAPAPAPPGQIPAASVVGAAPPMDMPRDSAAERSPEPRPTRGAFRPPQAPQAGAAARAPAAPVALGTAEPAGRERINVSPSAAQPRLNPTLNQAYLLLQSGSLDEARALYTKLSQAEPLNVDALLGLAYIAAQDNRSDEAMKLYVRILQLNPRHAVAQGALIGLMGRADPAASESRLKQLIAREPSAFLHFVLGNLYADQSLWAQAQQAYFQAHHLEPENPDYAYNLAIGLDQLRQAKLALNFYRRAEQLALTQGRSNFNVSHARERIRALTSQLE